MAAAFENYTQLKQTVAARQEEAERLHLLLKVTHILPWEADFPSSRFTYVGEEAANLLGYPLVGASSSRRSRAGDGQVSRIFKRA